MWEYIWSKFWRKICPHLARNKVQPPVQKFVQIHFSREKLLKTFAPPHAGGEGKFPKFAFPLAKKLLTASNDSF